MRQSLAYNLSLYLSLGARVFPLTRGDKKPKRGFRWKQDATTDRQTIERLVEEEGGGFGVLCEHFDVIDLDSVESAQTFCELTAQEEGNPCGLPRPEDMEQAATYLQTFGFGVVKTGKGLHLYVQPTLAGSRTGIEIKPGVKKVDLRSVHADGTGIGYVVGAGSPVVGAVSANYPPTGRTEYVWQGTGPHELADLRRAPRWFEQKLASGEEVAPPDPLPLVDSLPTMPESRVSGGGYDFGNVADLDQVRVDRFFSEAIFPKIDKLSHEPEGSRNLTLYQVAVDAANWCATYPHKGPEVSARLAAAARAAGLPEAEIAATLQSAWAHGSKQPKRIEDLPDKQPSAAVLPEILANALSAPPAEEVEDKARSARVQQLVPEATFDPKDRIGIAYHLAQHWVRQDDSVLVVKATENDLRWYIRKPDGRWSPGAATVERIVEDVCRYRLKQVSSKGAESPLLVSSNAKVADALKLRAGDVRHCLPRQPRAYSFLRDPLPGGWFLMPDGRVWNLETQTTRPAPTTYWTQRFELACEPKAGPTTAYEAAFANVGITGERLRRLDQILGLVIFGKGRNLGRAPLFVGDAGTGKGVLKDFITLATGGRDGCCNADMRPAQIEDNSFHRTFCYQYRVLIIDDKQDQLRKAESSWLVMASGELGARTIEEKFGEISQIETEQVWLTLANKIPPIGEAGGRASRRWLALQFGTLDGQRDAGLLDKLKAEMPAILWRAAMAIKDVHGPQEFDVIEDDEDMEARIEEEGSVYARWIDQRLTIDPTNQQSEMSSAWLLCDFKGWCTKTHTKQGEKDRAAQCEISRILKKKGCAPSHNKKARGFAGIKLADHCQPWDEEGNILSTHQMSQRGFLADPPPPEPPAGWTFGPQY